ncbi:uncharacterized protein PRCAT00005585001 [Priceomyces carsonii]|uniref:uncharacterized protein n=1 Tax=Priceomyces carsonii TaxID=28549 RepID=UPI002EDA4313|nr:unnamed protein product [Priceomyces carsonii]
MCPQFDRLSTTVTSSNTGDDFQKGDCSHRPSFSTNESQVSNLTKNLLSSSASRHGNQSNSQPNDDNVKPSQEQNQRDLQRQSQEQNKLNQPGHLLPEQLQSQLEEEQTSQQPLPNHPPSYSVSEISNSSQSNKFVSSFGQSGMYFNQQHPPSYPDHGAVNNSFTYRAGNNSMNYIPSDHNTPTMVSSSYSSNPPHTPSFQNMNMKNSNHFVTQPYNQSQSFSGNLKPSVMNSAQAIPTTNVSMDSVNSSSFTNTSFANPFSRPATVAHSQNKFPHSLPNVGLSQAGFVQAPTPFQRFSSINDRQVSDNESLSQEQFQPEGTQGITSHPQLINLEPDHYMTYKEFLHNLNVESSIAANENNAEAEEHLNIIDYPVNDLIMMLACLLTKIIEANDKLHPNHFDNTINIRHKLKEQRKLKKLRKLEAQKKAEGLNINDFSISFDDVEISDDEQDEKKNKYLANVLAFHGKNVPGISLHAYLARVLKYCPVTNEVFLSLLVYFDRIAKKANNLKKHENEGAEGDEMSEQLFVMDSYNIHRLIIAGITVSSKFFSDIFYKNLRYAKVGGLPLEELNYLELQFLLLLDFKLMISVEDLQNYGDLLLRFWKREQVTSELVNPDVHRS